MSGKFNCKREDREGKSIIALEGIIDEDALLESVFFEPKPEVEIDLSRVTRINSCGVRTWVNAISEISACRKVTFTGCSPSVVRQFNMISNFGGSGEVVSFKLPYFCSQCDREFDIESAVDEYIRDNPQYTAPQLNCPECGKNMEFDDLEDKYFHFLKHQNR